MELDKETLADLSIFNKSGGFSVFDHLNFTHTAGGKEVLEEIFKRPLRSISAIQDRQETLLFIQENKEDWPTEINNGTVMVVEKFLSNNGERIPLETGLFSTIHGIAYRFLMKDEYSAIHYSINHLYVFLKSMSLLQDQYSKRQLPKLLEEQLDQVAHLLERKEILDFLKLGNIKKLTFNKTLQYGHYLKHRHGKTIRRLLNVYYLLDAWYSMAVAGEKLQFAYPQFVPDKEPVLEMNQLFHPLLEKPVAYDVKLNKHTNFLFLTGANMAGKSTFIKAVGLSTFLAHIGMAVPAKKMKLTFFEGLLSNIQVEDNIFKGESYFYNEVQRIKKTILKINDGKRWLILIDEMFKGTNFQDAKHCSIMVIEGLLKMNQSLFVLSTHLYEIADALKKHQNITFRYFDTAVEHEEPQYSYQLKEGISNDRLGFLILKREKVLNLLNKIE